VGDTRRRQVSRVLLLRAAQELWTSVDGQKVYDEQARDKLCVGNCRVSMVCAWKKKKRITSKAGGWEEVYLYYRKPRVLIRQEECEAIKHEWAALSTASPAESPLQNNRNRRWRRAMRDTRLRGVRGRGQVIG
jgi:hypothetical protein